MRYPLSGAGAINMAEYAAVASGAATTVVGAPAAVIFTALTLNQAKQLGQTLAQCWDPFNLAAQEDFNALEESYQIGGVNPPGANLAPVPNADDT